MESEYFPAANFDGNCDLPVGDSCFQLLKPSFDEVNQHRSLDVLPIIIDEASFPVEEKCAFRNSNVSCPSLGQDFYEFSMLSEESNTTSLCTSQLAFLSFVELPLPPKKQMCLDAQFSCQNFIDLQMESTDSCSPCVVDIDIEMETIAKPKSGDITVGSIKNEDLVTGVVQRQANLKTCERFMQLLTNHLSSLLKLISKDKSFAERVHDTPNNRWRRYKRASSFDSRKIVLLFSIIPLNPLGLADFMPPFTSYMVDMPIHAQEAQKLFPSLSREVPTISPIYDHLSLPFILMFIKQVKFGYADIDISNTESTLEYLNFSSFTNLLRLDLAYNQFSGTIPSDIGILSKLQFLDLSTNLLIGTTLPLSLPNLTQVEFPEEMGNCKHLFLLALDDNHFYGLIPSSLGKIPDEVFLLKQLEALALSSNQVSAEIPAQLGKLSKLLSLNLKDNMLSGQVPVGIGGLSNTDHLDLSMNMLSGPIPCQIGECSRLQVLGLCKNNLNIPSQFEKLTSLAELNLSHNNLTGSIPASPSNMLSLFSVNLSYNDLEG
ncbi:unnamed protein product [Dovyalis caffra]|uniref:Toll-like receptor 15 n=1 Tax=Dovyalis caffra TaxID=77055 RepID=A0AAV1RE56_9ROSI|nr:unnamed protein product [Dovyalis caffra]